MTPKELCLKLMLAESGAEVENLLKEAGYWDNPDCWRLYGDTESNMSQAGSQANEAESALVEKITNSRDARLMMECRLRGKEPDADENPSSVKEAIAEYFGVGRNSDVAGEIRELKDSERRALAEGNTIAVTGFKAKEGLPCISIADNGEGQTPTALPRTILSLSGGVKNTVKFAHGKFNMGGTASLRFCKLQFVLSKRHPNLLGAPSRETDSHWGFTIVRREAPQGKRRSSWYKYLAPINSSTKPGQGDVLSFESSEFPIFPESNNPYKRNSEHGTLIKLYEYITKFKSHALLPDGLLSAMDLHLPDIGLPVRVHECRDYLGKKGSWENTLNGLQTRLYDDKVSNLEFPDPITEDLRINGNSYKLSIYVFKDGKAGTYRTKDKAVLVTLNGQAQDWKAERFFTTKKVDLDYIADSLLVIVDCSGLSYEAQEDLFQNSRDRTSTLPIAEDLEEELKDSLKNNRLLRDLQQKRRQERALSKLSNSKPLETVLRSLLKSSPTLARIFSQGTVLSNPFQTNEKAPTISPFEGKKFPTFFKVKGHKYGELWHKNCPLNSRARIFFETDVQNDYFKRDNSPGSFKLFQKNSGNELEYDNYKINLSNGIATLNIRLPESLGVGQKISFCARLTDLEHLVPFENNFEIVITREKLNDGGGGDRRLPPGNEKGDDREVPSGITIPENVIEVAKDPTQDQSSWQAEGFDRYSGLAIKSNGTSKDESNANGFDWYINVDNIFLQNEVKSRPDKADLLKAQFKYALILLGLSVLYSDTIKGSTTDEEKSEVDPSYSKLPIADKIKFSTRSICPVLIPIINNLSELVDEPAVAVE